VNDEPPGQIPDVVPQVRTDQPPAPKASPPISSGYAETVDRRGSVAAPLLAGFAVTLLGLVVDKRASIRWPEATESLLVSASIGLVISLQCFIAGRQFHVPRGEFDSSVEITDEKWRDYSHGRNEDQFRTWAARSRIWFNIGLALMFLGLAAFLAPKEAPFEPASWSSWSASLIALLACVGELIWIVAEERLAVRWSKQL